MRSTLQTVSGRSYVAPSDLICPLTGKVLVDPLLISTYKISQDIRSGKLGHYNYLAGVLSYVLPDGVHSDFYYFEKAAIVQILNTTGILPIFNVPITSENIRGPESAFMKKLQQFHAKQAEQAALQAAEASLAAAPQLVPVYQSTEDAIRITSVATTITSTVTATVKNPPKKEGSFLQTFASLFTREKSMQPTATATVQAPSQQALATTSPLATTTQSAVADRILLSVSQKGYLKVSFPTEAMCEKVFSGLDDANLITRRGHVLYIPARKKETNEGELPTLCATFSSSAVLQRFAVERVKLKENDRIKFGTGEQSSHLFLSHENYYLDTNASLKIRIPTWLQQQVSAAPQASVAPQVTSPKR